MPKDANNSGYYVALPPISTSNLVFVGLNYIMPDDNSVEFSAIDIKRIMALSFIMVLCLLIYRLAEVRLRSRLAQTQQTIPDQLHQPTARPTMRWVFQYFEGIELVHIQTATASRVLVLRLQPVHRLILQLFGPLYEKFYLLSG